MVTSRRYPIGEQDFANIRKDNLLYIDKTALVPFEADGRTLYKISINYSIATRRIDEWKVE